MRRTSLPTAPLLDVGWGSNTKVSIQCAVQDCHCDFIVEDDLKKDYPGMAQSSASDSSSEAGDMVAEKEEDVDEWAIDLLNNMKEEGQSLLDTMKDGRSPSIGSEDDSDGLSSSPKGFWHTHRPGSPSLDSLDDDESWDLSPETSPMHQVELASAPDRDYSLMPEPPLKEDQPKTFRSPTVTFADDAWLDRELEVPSNQADATILKPKCDGGRMKRSQSYSAISALHTSPHDIFSHGKGHRMKKFPDPLTREYEVFRDYFLKFVDLVIVREMKAATSQV